MNHFLLLTLLAITAHSIFIPLKPNRARCLSEYLISGAASTIKIKINFPKLEGLESGEHFTVSLRNTETQKITTEIVHPGDKYSKEEVLDQSTIFLN